MSSPQNYPKTKINLAISPIQSQTNQSPKLNHTLIYRHRNRLKAVMEHGTLGLLKRTVHPATPKVKETAYNMLIRPKLEYATVACNPPRFILNDHRRKTSTTELINKLAWETFETQQDKTEPHKYQVTTTHHNPMLLYTKQQSKQVHTNPRTHQYICIFILSKSH